VVDLVATPEAPIQKAASIHEAGCQYIRDRPLHTAAYRYPRRAVSDLHRGATTG